MGRAGHAATTGRNRCGSGSSSQGQVRQFTNLRRNSHLSAGTRIFIKKPLVFVVFRENRTFFAVMRFFSIFGRKSHQNELKMAPKWRPKRSKTASKNELEKKCEKRGQTEPRPSLANERGMQFWAPGPHGASSIVMIYKVCITTNGLGFGSNTPWAVGPANFHDLLHVFVKN